MVARGRERGGGRDPPLHSGETKTKRFADFGSGSFGTAPLPPAQSWRRSSHADQLQGKRETDRDLV